MRHFDDIPEYPVPFSEVHEQVWDWVSYFTSPEERVEAADESLGGFQRTMTRIERAPIERVLNRYIRLLKAQTKQGAPSEAWLAQYEFAKMIVSDLEEAEQASMQHFFRFRRGQRVIVTNTKTPYWGKYGVITRLVDRGGYGGTPRRFSYYILPEGERYEIRLPEFWVAVEQEFNYQREDDALSFFQVGDEVRCVDGDYAIIKEIRRPPQTVIGPGLIILDDDTRIFYPSSLTLIERKGNEPTP